MPARSGDSMASERAAHAFTDLKKLHREMGGHLYAIAAEQYMPQRWRRNGRKGMENEASRARFDAARLRCVGGCVQASVISSSDIHASCPPASNRHQFQPDFIRLSLGVFKVWRVYLEIVPSVENP